MWWAGEQAPHRKGAQRKPGPTVLEIFRISNKPESQITVLYSSLPVLSKMLLKPYKTGLWATSGPVSHHLVASVVEFDTGWGWCQCLLSLLAKPAALTLRIL